MITFDNKFTVEALLATSIMAKRMGISERELLDLVSRAVERERNRKKRTWTPEQRAKLKAIHDSTEWRAQVSKRNKGKPVPPERRKAISNALKGRKAPSHVRAKISESLKGRIKSPETRAKISEISARNYPGSSFKKNSHSPKRNRRFSEVSRALGEDHWEAKPFAVRDPNGVVFEGKNAQKFARDNPHLFPDKSRDEVGKRLAAVNRGYLASWHGWTAVSRVSESILNQGTDLLSRS